MEDPPSTTFGISQLRGRTNVSHADPLKHVREFLLNWQMVGTLSYYPGSYLSLRYRSDERSDDSKNEMWRINTPHPKCSVYLL